ncbi:hypothetical protein [Thermosipho sp. 1074]|uniref:hypothetical protein n=1 Tax=Thermosipho sp. 1074 TaxID=1643331 RepID=UPI000985C45A|nr:hypothetical protein [Thermosipho sp. 1074]OOC42059.1 hypothetical protein XO08_07135 [Thermosipho sp. 1074]
MQKKYLILYLLIFNVLIFSISQHLGVKYIFRNTQFDKYLILTSSTQRTVIVYNMETEKIEYYFTNVGIFPAISYLDKNLLLIIDTVGTKLISINLKTHEKNLKHLEKKPIFYQRDKDKVYILDTDGNLYGYSFTLHLKYYYKFLSAPNYFYMYKNYPLGLFIWKKEVDLEYKKKLYNFNLITPSFLVEDYVVDTRGGNILRLVNFKIYKTSPYISFVLNWNKKIYFGSMFSNEIYTIKNDKIELWKKLQYTPTNAKVINNKLYILSAPYNKLMVFNSNGNTKEFKTDKYPIDIFSYKNKVFVICAENGVINIF